MKFVNMDNSKALDQFVQKQCAALAKRMESRPNKYKISLTVEASSRTPEGVANMYKATGVIKVSRQADIRASKSNRDVKQALIDVVAALEKQIRRQTEKQERSRKTLGKSLKPVRHMKWEIQSHAE